MNRKQRRKALTWAYANEERRQELSGPKLKTAGAYTNRGGQPITRTMAHVPPVASRRVVSCDGFKPGAIKCK